MLAPSSDGEESPGVLLLLKPVRDVFCSTPATGLWQLLTGICVVDLEESLAQR